MANCDYHGWNGLKRDGKKAFDEFVKIEKETNGYHWAQDLLGVKNDVTQAVKWYMYTKSSEQGNSCAMNDLGCHYNSGRGVDEDKTKAFVFFEQSAHLGYRAGMYNLGNHYSYGKGVTKDVNKAKAWYAKAVTQGHMGAQAKLDALSAA